MKKFYNWLRKKLGVVQIEKELSGIYKTVNRLDHGLSKLRNQTRSGRRPQRYGEIERARKHRKKDGEKLARSYT